MTQEVNWKQHFKSVRISKQVSRLVHYLPVYTPLGTEDMYLEKCKQHGIPCAITLCGLHSKRGKVVEEQADCTNCVMEHSVMTPSEYAERVSM